MQTIERYKKELQDKLDFEISTPSVSYVLNKQSPAWTNKGSLLDASELNFSKLSKFMSGVKVPSKGIADHPFKQA